MDVKRLLLLILATVAYAGGAQAQDISSRFQGQVIGSRGVPLANQSVAVCSQPAVTTTQPCSPLATLATSTITSSGGANPLTTDVNGNFFFYAAPGKYTVQVYGAQVSGQFVQPDTLVGAAGPASLVTLNVSGTATFTGAVLACLHNGIAYIGSGQPYQTCWGSADLATQHAAAFAAAAAAGGHVHVVAGQYSTPNSFTVGAANKREVLDCDGGTGVTTITSTQTSGNAWNLQQGASWINDCTLVGSGGTTVGVFVGGTNGLFFGGMARNDISGFGGVGLQTGNNVNFMKLDHNIIHDNGSGKNALFGGTLTGEGIDIIGGLIKNQVNPSVANYETCVNITAPGLDFNTTDTSFDQCGITANATSVDLNINPDHMENPIAATTADWIVMGPNCTFCTLTISGGGKFAEDFASARTELFRWDATATTGGLFVLSGAPQFQTPNTVPVLMQINTGCCINTMVGTFLNGNGGGSFTNPINGSAFTYTGLLPGGGIEMKVPDSQITCRNGFGQEWYSSTSNRRKMNNNCGGNDPIVGQATVDIFTGAKSFSAAPVGASGNLGYGYDSTTGTEQHNANNNGASSFSGAWNCTNVTPVTVNANVSTDQNMMACTIPAGTLNRVGRSLRVKVKGIYSTPAASTSQMTLKLKLCTVSGCGSGTVITPINIQSTALGTVQITNDNFSLRSELTTQTAGASSAYEASGEFLIDLSTLTTAADSEFGDVNTATVGTIDSTAQLFLQCTFAFSVASGSNSATQRQLIAETVN